MKPSSLDWAFPPPPLPTPLSPSSVIPSSFSSFLGVKAFNPSSGQGVPIHFSPRNGRSLLSYSDGSVAFNDGEPKDSLVKPVTKILIGMAMLTLLIAMFLKETPEWFQTLTSRFSGRTFPPWILFFRQDTLHHCILPFFRLADLAQEEAVAIHQQPMTMASSTSPSSTFPTCQR